MKYKIGIWSQFGDGKVIADGQAVRMNIIADELRARYGTEQVTIVNSFFWKQNPIRFFIQSMKLVNESQIVIVAPADNGFKVFVPLLLVINLFFKRRLLYVVIGGFLPTLLSKKPQYIGFVNRFSACFVQTDQIKKDLEQFGIRNIYILSNLKRLPFRDQSELSLNLNERIKVCTLSRVDVTKGIEDAINAVKDANIKLGGIRIQLDIYGVVPSSYMQLFTELVNKNNSFVTYCGVIKYNETVTYLKEYFCMLFPTYYHGEGFPGNVVDAYYSGIPIIATDWLYNSNVIKDGYNGILVPIKSPERISEALLRLYHNRALHYKMSLNNLVESQKYTPDIVMRELYNEIDR